MKRKMMMSLITLLLAGIFAAVPVFAEDAVNAPEEDVFRIADEAETIDEVENRIMLPESASETARERSLKGRETAGQAREQGKEFGMDRSREAREGEMGMDRSREAREGDMGERARERMMDRENMQDKMHDPPRGPRTDG